MRPLNDLLHRYVTLLESLNYSPRTIRIRRYNIRAFLTWLDETHGVRTVDVLTSRHLRSWQLMLAQRRTTRGLPLRPRSINKNIESVRAFLEELHRDGQIPSRLVETLVYVKVPQLLPRVLTHAKIRRLLSRIDTTSPAGFRNRTMLELLYSSGLRASELLGLDVEHIDFGSRTALILGKGRKERLVPIGATAFRFLESYVRAIRPTMPGSAETKALFLDDGGSRLPYHTLRRIVERIAEASGLAGKLTPHVFRRSCTTELVKGNANLYHISRLLGHASLETLRHYVKLNIADVRKTHQKTHPRERDERRRNGPATDSQATPDSGS